MMNFEGYDKLMPPHIKEQLIAWFETGTKPSAFLHRALKNDFVSAVLCANTEELESIYSVASFIHHQLPAGAWGTRYVVDDWRKARLITPFSIKKEEEYRNGTHQRPDS